MALDPEFPNDKAVREAVALAAEARALRMAQGKAAAAQPPLDATLQSLGDTQRARPVAAALNAQRPLQSQQPPPVESVVRGLVATQQPRFSGGTPPTDANSSLRLKFKANDRMAEPFRTPDGKVMYSGQGSPVYKGRAKIKGVDQPVFTDSPYDPLLAGKTGAAAAKWLQDNPDLADKHAAALAPGAARLQRRTDAVAAAGPQYAPADFKTLTEAQQNAAEAGKIKAETGAVVDENDRANAAALLAARADSDALVTSIAEANGVSVPEALLLARQNKLFNPEVSNIESTQRELARQGIAELFKDFEDPSGAQFDPSLISMRDPSFFGNPNASVGTGPYDWLTSNKIGSYNGPRENDAEPPEIKLDEEGAKRLQLLLQILNGQKKAAQ